MRPPGGPPLKLDPEGLAVAIREGGRVLDRFLFEHRRAITRLFGGLDMFAGTGEILVGGRLLGIGASTSEVGIGLPAVLAGSWMILHGHDTNVTGWRALVTGNPQKTTAQQLLRRLGLSERQADAAELALSMLGGGSAIRSGRKLVDEAVNRELTRRALLAFDESVALTVRSEGNSLWSRVDILKRGDAWEVFDAERTGYLRTPKAKTFDQVSSDGRVVVSNKTLDLQRETYLRTDRKAIFTTLRGYINAAASYTPVHPQTKKMLKAPERRLHLLFRFGDSAEGQALQIAAAEQYAKDMGVILKVEYAF